MPNNPAMLVHVCFAAFSPASLVLELRRNRKIPQSGDMTHPFLYLSKSFSGDGKILISGCDKILC